MSIGILATLLLAGAALPAVDQAAINARVTQIFRPYSRPTSAPMPAVWDQHVFSAETAALIAHWKRAMPRHEVDDLNDGDWFCMCQDWDDKKFKAQPTGQRVLSPGVVEVTVRVDVGFDEPRNERMLFRKEGAAWLLDDLFAADGFEHGLKQALRETIATDEALTRKKQR